MLSAIAERAIEPDDMVHQTTITTLAARAAKSFDRRRPVENGRTVRRSLLSGWDRLGTERDSFYC